MAKAKKKDRAVRRLTLLLPQRSADRLDRLKEMTDAASGTEVLRNALLAYEVLAEAAASGARIMKHTPGGELEILPITLDVEFAGDPDDGESLDPVEDGLRSTPAPRLRTA